MALPRIAPKRATVTFSDETTAEVHGLTLSQVRRIAELADREDTTEAQIVAHVLHYGADVTVAEAEDWYDNSPAEDVKTMITTITELSGMGDKDSPLGSTPSSED